MERKELSNGIELKFNNNGVIALLKERHYVEDDKVGVTIYNDLNLLVYFVEKHPRTSSLSLVDTISVKPLILSITRWISL